MPEITPMEELIIKTAQSEGFYRANLVLGLKLCFKLEEAGYLIKKEDNKMDYILTGAGETLANQL